MLVLDDFFVSFDHFRDRVDIFWLWSVSGEGKASQKFFLSSSKIGNVQMKYMVDFNIVIGLVTLSCMVSYAMSHQWLVETVIFVSRKVTYYNLFYLKND